MKYILLVLILFLSSCSYVRKIEDYNYIENNSIRFIRKDDDTSLLIRKDDVYYLYLLNKENVKISVDYLIVNNDISTDNIKYGDKIIFNDDFEVNGILFKRSDKIEINFNNKNICIYIKDMDKNNYSSCDIIYLYKHSNI